MLDKLQRILDILTNLPNTLQAVRDQITQLVTLGHMALLVLLGFALAYLLRAPIRALVGMLRYREMRDIDDRESESEEARAITDVARARAGGAPVTEQDLLDAVPIYYKIVRAAKQHREENS